ncbi:hypothetical protein D5086_017157 [Populus alba]|uniref:Uncharacterized protein n=1 Tax=Populus alba TaxID=43335 RepID=A0ACC4BWP3_POPAL
MASRTAAMLWALSSPTPIPDSSSSPITTSTCPEEDVNNRTKQTTDSLVAMKIPRSTASRESAPSAVNVDAPATGVPVDSAHCFSTISRSLSTVSGLACTGKEISIDKS